MEMVLRYKRISFVRPQLVNTRFLSAPVTFVLENFAVTYKGIFSLNSTLALELNLYIEFDTVHP